MEAMNIPTRVSRVPVVLFTLLGGTSLVDLLRPDDRPLPALDLIIVVSSALVLLFLLVRSLAITEREVIVRAGPSWTSVPISSIRRIRRAERPLGMRPWNELEIEHGMGNVTGVSPRDTEGFIAALRERNPAIEVR